MKKTKAESDFRSRLVIFMFLYRKKIFDLTKLMPSGS